MREQNWVEAKNQLEFLGNKSCAIEFEVGCEAYRSKGG